MFIRGAYAWYKALIRSDTEGNSTAVIYDWDPDTGKWGSTVVETLRFSKDESFQDVVERNYYEVDERQPVEQNHHVPDEQRATGVFVVLRRETVPVPARR
jgi:hypothetical protein